MSTTSDDIQAAGSDTRPPMLDRTDYESWAQRFRLYCKSKKNGHLILQSIDEGPFRMGMFRKKLGVTVEGEVMFEPERPRTYADLDYHEQERYKADFRTTIFLLEGLTKDVCTRPEVQDPDNDIDHVGKKHEVHEIHYEVQQTNVLDSDSADMGNSNIIPYEQYVKHYEGLVIPSGESSVPNDAYVMHENSAYVPDDSLTTKLNIYKEHVAIYEQRAKFELTDRKQKMDDQIRAQNPFYLRKAKVAQPTLYDGDEILKTHHVPVSVTSSEEDLEIAEITRQKMNEKMNDPTQLTPEQVFWSNDLLKQRAEALKTNSPPLPILPPATVYPPNTPVHLVPRTLLTTSQVNMGLYVITQLFWDFEKTYKKRITPTGITEGEKGFEQTKRCYLTEVIPFLNLLKEHYEEVQRSLVKEVRAMKAVFNNMEAEVDQNAIDKKCGEIGRKNLLITNENLIANCIAQDVFYTVTDSALNASRFHDLSVAYNVAKTRTVELEAENSKLRDKIQNNDHDNMVKHFSKLEIDNLNLQLKYQHLKECIDTSNSKTSKGAPEFDAVFELNKKDDQLQAHRNTNRNLKAQMSQLKANKSDVIGTHEPTSLDSQHLKFQDTVTKLQEQNDFFQAENTKIENLKTQVKGKMPVITSNCVVSKVSDGKVLKYVYANKKEPRQSWGSIVPDVPSSSLDECMSSKLYKCLRSKDEAPDFIIKMIQVRFKVLIQRIRTDNGTEFVNQTLCEYYEKAGISHETLLRHLPQQNGVVERRNRTLIEAARTMLIYAKAPENLGKLQPKADISIFIGYAPTKKAFRIYNRRTRRIIETIHVDFDELTAMASEHSSSGPALYEMTPATIS
ncbi:retrovirus-related pol polyprotein from transposon TNT 1-94 [Tanacetum coccineum]